MHNNLYMVIWLSWIINNKVARIISIVTWPVSRHSKTRQLKGVREDSRYGKQICVLVEDMKGTIEPNILYSVELKPMHKAKGYVVVAATPVQFPAIAEYIIVPKLQKLYTLVYRLIVWRLKHKIFGSSVSNHYLCTPDMG